MIPALSALLVALAGPAPASCAMQGIDSTICGTVSVYEDRAKRSGRKIALNYVIHPAARRTTAPAVFFVAGGPGQASTAIAAWSRDTIAALHRNHDLVFVDQRGTGASNALACDMYPTLDAHFARLFPTNAVVSCRESVLRHADPAMYRTDFAADDLNDARSHLGYNRIDLFAVSYGTQLALDYVRRHRSTVARVVLIGVDPPGGKTQLNAPLAAQRALDAVITACGSDARCAARYPSLRDEVASALHRFDAGPVDVTLHDPQTHAPVTVHLSRGAFTGTLHQMLYSDDTIALIPAMVDAASHGNFAPFAFATILFDRLFVANMALGTTLSAVCGEQLPFVSDSAMASSSAGTFVGTDFYDEEKSACTAWTVPSVDTAYAAAVRTDVPILMISGENDPATYPANATEILAGMPNASQIVVPKAQHIPGGACVDDLVSRFVEGAAAKSLAWQCAQPPAPLNFALELPAKLQNL